MISFARLRGGEPKLLEMVEEVNEQLSAHTVSLAKKELGGKLKGKRIALLGLSFKPDTDDMREAPSIKIANHLYSQEAEIIAYDPKSIPNARDKFIRDTIQIAYADSVEECLEDADCCIIATEWEEFKTITPDAFNTYMKRYAIVDGRRIYNTEMPNSVDVYQGIGLGSR